MDFITAILQLLKENNKIIGIDFVNVVQLGDVNNEQQYNENIKLSLDKDEFGSVIYEPELTSWFPTYEEALARCQILKEQQEYLEAYATPRRRAYPKVEELADAIYWQAKGDNSKMEAYLAAVEAVKETYPKPDQV